MPNDLLDVPTLATYLRLPREMDEETRNCLELLADGAADAIERHCRRSFGRGEVSEVFSGRGTGAVFLARRPVTAVRAVWDDPGRAFAAGRALPSTSYAVEPATGILRLHSGKFRHGAGNVRVDYTGGYASIPPALRQAALLLAAYYFQHARQGADGLQGESVGGYSVQYDHGQWPEHVLALLADFKTVDF